jgi:translation initiation factor IF-1
MANKNNKQVKEGVVIEAFPNALFKVKNSDDQANEDQADGGIAIHRV